MQAPKFFDYLKFSKKYYVVPAIFYINLVLYLAVSVAGKNFWFPDPVTMIKFGANDNVLTLQGQWWRMISSMFLHYGALHFLSNMYALTRIGYILESFVGSWRLAFAYFFTGICSGILSTGWHTMSVGAGASGAIFGLFGLFLALVTTEFVAKQNRWPLVKTLGINIIINLLIGTQFHIDNAAHIGGLIGGIVAGYLMYGIYKVFSAENGGKKRAWIFNSSLFILSVSIILFVLPSLSKDPVKISMLVNKIDSEINDIQSKFYSEESKNKNPDFLKISQEWESVEQDCKKLSEFKMDSRMTEISNFYLNKVELRKQEAQLLYRLENGEPGLDKQLKAVQQQLEIILKNNPA